MALVVQKNLWQALRNVGLLDWDNFANFYSTMWLGQNRVISPEEAHTTFRRVSACAAAGYARFTLARGVPLFLPKMLKVLLMQLFCLAAVIVVLNLR